MAKFDPFLSLDCARVEGVGAQSKERKGSNFAAQRSGAIVQKPEGLNAYNLKNLVIAIWQPCLPPDAAEEAERASLISLARSAFFRSAAYSEAS